MAKSCMKNTHYWGRKMTQWVKCLLCKHKDLSSDLHHPRKHLDTEVCAYNYSFVGAETNTSSEL